MSGKLNFKGWLANKKIRWAVLSAAWIVLLITVAIPSWQGVMQRNAEIHDLEDRLATLDDWTVAGMWLAPSVRQRTLPVNAAFSRLFPAQRDREDLFLSLAKVADESGVDDFGLNESLHSSMDNNDVWSDGAAMGDNAPPPPTDETAMQGDTGAGMTLEIPSVDLRTYRVKAHFNADYKRIAHFMGGLKNIERALKVNSLVVRPEKDGIRVDLELDVYVSQTS